MCKGKLPQFTVATLNEMKREPQYRKKITCTYTYTHTLARTHAIEIELTNHKVFFEKIFYDECEQARARNRLQSDLIEKKKIRIVINLSEIDLRVPFSFTLFRIYRIYISIKIASWIDINGIGLWQTATGSIHIFFFTLAFFLILPPCLPPIQPASQLFLRLIHFFCVHNFISVFVSLWQIRLGKFFVSHLCKAMSLCLSLAIFILAKLCMCECECIGKPDDR